MYVILILGTSLQIHEERKEVPIVITESHSNDNLSLSQLTNDSGIGLSIVTNNESELTENMEEERKLDEESDEVSETSST